MTDPTYDAIRVNPKFQELIRTRSQLAWRLFAISMVMFFGLIFVVAFAPGLLSRPIFEGGVTTIGWPIGAAIVIISWIFTGIYVRHANAQTEAVRQIIVEASR